MNRLILLLSLALSAVSVMAAHCVKDAEAIDAALVRMELSVDQRSQVIILKDEGLALHNNGDHRGAEHKLAEGMRVLLENVISSTPMEHKMGEMDHNMEGGGCCAAMGDMEHNMEGGSCCSGMGEMGGMKGMDHNMEGMGSDNMNAE
jgi:hypothetical protein